MSIAIERVAVCSWSLQPTSPQALVDAMREIGLTRVQIGLNPILDGGQWTNCSAILQDAGITLVSGMLATVGEDYSSLGTIKATGGIVPDSTWPKSWANIQAMAPIAASLKLKLVTFHLGFVPQHEHDPAYQTLVKRVIQIADLYQSHGIDLGFETGQEDAPTLQAFLEQVDRPNVGVNFDPANMVLYDKGDPIAALHTLAPLLKQCHIKDAIRATTVGNWGLEVAVGTGQINWSKFFTTLDELGYRGLFAIEREAGEQRVADVKAATHYITNLS